MVALATMQADEPTHPRGLPWGQAGTSRSAVWYLLRSMFRASLSPSALPRENSKVVMWVLSAYVQRPKHRLDTL